MSILRACHSRCLYKSNRIVIRRWPCPARTSSWRASSSRHPRTWMPWKPCFRLPSNRSQTTKLTLRSKRWKSSRASRETRSKRRVFCRNSPNYRRFMRSKSHTWRKRATRVTLPSRRGFSSWSKSATSQYKTGTRLRMNFRGHWLRVRWKIAVFQI